MMSETYYATHHSAAWASLMPGSDLFVRRLNFDLSSRAFASMTSVIAAHRRAIVNETAFNYFSSNNGLTAESTMSAAFEKAKVFIYQVEATEDALIGELSEDETAEVREQARRMELFIGSDQCLFRPAFSGCGIINSCEGDLLKDKCLFEIKAGDRPFRSIDLRQIIVYLALNGANMQHEIESVCLFNPRRGMYFRQHIDHFCLNASGKSFVELTSDVVDAVSGGSLSN